MTTIVNIYGDNLKDICEALLSNDTLYDIALNVKTMSSLKEKIAVPLDRIYVPDTSTCIPIYEKGASLSLTIDLPEHVSVIAEHVREVRAGLSATEPTLTLEPKYVPLLEEKGIKLTKFEQNVFIRSMEDTYE